MSRELVEDGVKIIEALSAEVIHRAQADGMTEEQIKNLPVLLAARAYLEKARGK